MFKNHFELEIMQNRGLTDIHGAFHDEGRITRLMDSDFIWGVLGKRSIDRYRDIERESGM